MWDSEINETAYQVKIFRGSPPPGQQQSDINVVIDVIRAFSLAHLAFYKGAMKIHLVASSEEAFLLREKNPGYILTGEINGIPISGFDTGNSPASISDLQLQNKILVQRTTNGVKTVLKCLQASHIFVTGFTCARNTALHIKSLIASKNVRMINIITSHPSGDDDFACAEYIKDLILNKKGLSADKVSERIKSSEAAMKFLDPNIDIFNEDDIRICATEIPSNFTMQVDKLDSPPSIRKVIL